jgi:DNA gyrase subunit A
VPRTLRLDQMIRYYVEHQVDVIVRRTRYQLRKARERLHVLEGLLMALDYLDAVIALIRNAESADVARQQLMEGRYAAAAAADLGPFRLTEIQATAILDMQLRRLAALERQRIIDEAAELRARVAELEAILASPPRQREIISEELQEVVDKYGDERRTRIVPFEGEMSIEDLIAQEDVVVTVTRGGYAKRTKTDLYRSQKRGGKGVQGAALREDDIVEHFFVTTTHHTLLFFTNKGRVYRAKAHELPEQARSAKGQHVANILAFGQDERIAEVMAIRDYAAADYLVLATRRGLCKKSALTDFDSNRAGGLVAINLREDDEVIGARLVGSDDDLLLVSRRAQSIRFHADDEQLRPMGRATAGVIGMRFDVDDELLSIEVVKPDATADLLVATSGGFAKRTPLTEYPVQGRGGKGVLTAKIVPSRGPLVGALVVAPDDQLYAIASNGGVLRTVAKDVRRAQRQTMGVKLIDLEAGVQVVGIARNAEAEAEAEDGDGDEPAAD